MWNSSVIIWVASPKLPTGLTEIGVPWCVGDNRKNHRKLRGTLAGQVKGISPARSQGLIVSGWK